METESGSGGALGLSLVEAMLLLVFAALIVYVTDNVEGRGQEPHQGVDQPQSRDPALQATLDAASAKSDDLERQVHEMRFFVNELKLMVGAKVPTKEGFQEAIDNLKRGYALCQKHSNTLIEASVQNGVEALQVIGDIPADLIVDLAKGDQTSDLDQIVSFIQDVYQYEKDHGCRFNYRLKYATDNDYKKGEKDSKSIFILRK
jgi:hypothetical protein